MSEARLPIGARLNTREKRIIVFTLVLALFVSSINQQIVSVASPQLVGDLGGFSLLPWVFTSYMLTSTVVIPVVGKLSDTFGRKPFLMFGVVLFIAGSLACALSVSMLMLVAARCIQGVGGGFVTATVLATIADLFPPAERGKYVSYFFAAGSIAQLSGPSFGGVLTDTIGWRWCFLVSIPFALISLWFTATHLPREDRKLGPLRLDLLGSALLAAATTALLLALSWARQEFGWASSQTIGLLAAAVVFTAAFLWQERRHPNPVMPLFLFQSRTFSIGMTLHVLANGAFIGAMTYLPTFVQVALGTSATASGLITTPQALSSLLGSFVAGQLAARTGRYRIQLIVAVVVLLSASLAMSTLSIGDPQWRVGLFVGAAGLGSSALIASLSVAVLNAVPVSAVGVASATRGFSLQIGSVLGVAVLGAVLSSSYHHSFASELDAQARAGIPTAIVDEFDDPTLTINKPRLADVRAKLAESGQGESFLVEATAAQRRAVATANQHVFLAAAIMLAAGLAISLGLGETPLRRTFEAEPAVAGAPAESTASAREPATSEQQAPV